MQWENGPTKCCFSTNKIKPFSSQILFCGRVLCAVELSKSPWEFRLGFTSVKNNTKHPNNQAKHQKTQVHFFPNTAWTDSSDSVQSKVLQKHHINIHQRDVNWSVWIHRRNLKPQNTTTWHYSNIRLKVKESEPGNNVDFKQRVASTRIQL